MAIPIVRSMLDSDLYKFTQQNAILELYPDAVAEYVFINRDKNYTFNERFLKNLKESVEGMAGLALGLDEKDWMRDQCPYLKPSYLEYLYNYRFNPGEVKMSLKDGQLVLTVFAKWHRSVLWEVPLMATISELYFEDVYPELRSPGGPISGHTIQGQKDRAIEKGYRLSGGPGDGMKSGCKFADFGTRRRRSFDTQFAVVDAFHNGPGRFGKGNHCFVGTSNPYLAFRFGITPIGTIAHEFIMAQAVLNGLRHANRFAMDDWCRVYKSSLGIMLTDTYGVDSFLEDFSLYHAKLWDGVRQDSGDPFEFTDKMVDHYRQLRIDPMSKTIVFSDSLTVEKAIELNEYCIEKGIKCSFGIGTHLTNDYPDKKALNMVIKLKSINGIPVVKLSEDPRKAIGDPDAIRVARWTFSGDPL
jgi:nicotinate phosphoribosyltransferase